MQFSKLGKIEVGGTKGKTLTTSVQQIFADFENAVEAFKAVTYDIMDVSAKQFDDDFYEFRCKIKELERSEFGSNRFAFVYFAFIGL